MRFAFDGQLDLIARDLGLDPVAIRLRNAMEKGYATPAKYYFASCGLKECIQKSAKKGRLEKEVREIASVPRHRDRLRDAALRRQGNV